MRYSTTQVNIDLLLRRNQMETTSSFGTQNSMRCFLRFSVASTLLEILKGRHPIVGRAIRNGWCVRCWW